MSPVVWNDEFNDGVSRKINPAETTSEVAMPAIGPSGDGADARAPEPVLKTVSTNIPQPDNTGPKGGGALWPDQGV